MSVLAAAALPCAAATSGATAVPAGNARFRFLTADLLRMEYPPAAKFVDAQRHAVRRAKPRRESVVGLMRLVVYCRAT